MKCGVESSPNFKFNEIKCVIVGDKFVGKSTLLSRYANGQYLEVPSSQTNFYSTLEIEDENFFMELIDMDGHENDKLRSLYYPNTQLIFLCFSLVDQISLQNVRTKWYPEIKSHCPDTPIILIGTKLDLRHDPETIEHLQRYGQAPVKRLQGLFMAESIGSTKYIECSPKTQRNLKTIIDDIVGPVLRDMYKRSSPRPKKKCVIW